MNKTLTFNSKDTQKVYPIFVGWNIAQWGKSNVPYDVDGDGGDFYVDNIIPLNHLKMILAEAQISPKSVYMRYYTDGLKGMNKPLVNTFTLLEELCLLNISDLIADDDDYIEIEVPFSDCELVEKVFKKFKIMD